MYITSYKLYVDLSVMAMSNVVVEVSIMQYEIVKVASLLATLKLIRM